MSELNGLGKAFANMQTFIKKMDKDGDGKASTKEVVASAKETVNNVLFEGIDPSLLSDENKAKLVALQAGEEIVDAELKSATVEPPVVKTEFDSEKAMLEYIDTNGDGVIGEEELRDAIALFNKNGVEKVKIDGKEYNLVTDIDSKKAKGNHGDDLILAVDTRVLDGNGGDDIFVTYNVDKIKDGLFDKDAQYSGRYKEISQEFDSLQAFQDYIETFGDKDGVCSEEEIQKAAAYFTENGITEIVIDGKAYNLVTANGGDLRKGDNAKNKNDLFLVTNVDKVKTGAGDDIVIAADVGEIDTGFGDDAVITAGKVDKVDTGWGDDYVKVNSDYTKVDTGSNFLGFNDSDVVEVNGDHNKVSTGNGHDTITVRGNENTIDSGAANDEISVYGSANNINAGMGDDILNVMGGEDNDFSGGMGNDKFYVHVAGNNLEGNMGKDDFYLMNEELNASVLNHSKNSNDDSTTLFGGNSVDGGMGNDSFHKYVAPKPPVTPPVTPTEPEEFLPGPIIQRSIMKAGVAVPSEVDTASEWDSYLRDFIQTPDFSRLPKVAQEAIYKYLGLDPNGQDLLK